MSVERARTRKVFLHIGAPKTGTTYIQAMMWHHAHRLKASGVFVPGHRQADHFQIGAEIRGERVGPDSEFVTGAPSLDAALEAFDASGCHTLLISDERLAKMGEKRIDALFHRLASYDVHVVYGMRDLAGLLTSSWQERVKNGEWRQFEPWLDMIAGRREGDIFWSDRDALAVIERWRTPDGDHFHFLTLPVSGASQTELWKRFTSIIGWTAPRFGEFDRPNESLGFVEASLVAMIQERIRKQSSRKRKRSVVKLELANGMLAGRPGRVPILIPERHREWIEAETNRRLAYLADCDLDVVGDVEELRDSDRRFGVVSLDDHISDVLDVSLDVIGSLVEQVATQKERNARRRNKIKGTPAKRIALHDAASVMRRLRPRK